MRWAGRSVVALTLLCAAFVPALGACGSSDTGSSASGGDAATSESGAGAFDGAASDANGGSAEAGLDAADASAACTPAGQACGSGNRCCGVCARTHCADENVDFGATCAPAPCGGDPTGTWTLVSACGLSPQPSCATPTGGATLLGTTTITIAPGQAAELDYTYRLEACSYVDESGHKGGFEWSPDGGPGTSTNYCVQGSTLWILYSDRITALKFTK